MSVTQKDIASALNLSQGLVAQVLGNHPGLRATEETRQRILRAARQMQYRPHAAARSLRSGRTNVILFAHLLPENSNIRGVYAGLTETLAECLGAVDYSLQIRAFATPTALRHALSDAAATRSCDGVFLTGPQSVVQEQGALLEEKGVPFAVFGRCGGNSSHWMQADFDHEGMMRGAVGHLRAQGHERIGFFGFADPPLENAHRENVNDEDAAAHVYTAALRDGFTRAMQEAGGMPFFCTVGEDLPPAADSLTRWLSLPEPERPTAAIIATGDRVWQETEAVLARHGQCVGAGPGEFALAGITDEPYPLLLGQGHAYAGLYVDPVPVTEALALRLLLPRLRGEPVMDNQVRLLPPLLPTAPYNVPSVSRLIEDMISCQKRKTP